MRTFCRHSITQICGSDSGSIQYNVWPQYLSAKLYLFPGADAFVYGFGLPGAETKAKKDQYGGKPEVGRLISLVQPAFMSGCTVSVKVPDRNKQIYTFTGGAL